MTADSPTGSADPYNDMFEWFSATELKCGGHIGAVASCGIWNHVKNQNLLYLLRHAIYKVTWAP